MLYDDGSRKYWETFDKYTDDECKEIKSILEDKNNTFITFNGRGYDFPMMCKMIYDKNSNVKSMKAYNDKIMNKKSIVKSNGKVKKVMYKHWEVEEILRIPKYFITNNFNHIDVMEVVDTPEDRGLKACAMSLKLENVMDLPFPVGVYISKIESNLMKKYCFLDCEMTKNVYYNLLERVELREVIKDKYKLKWDMRSEPDKKLGVDVFKTLCPGVRKGFGTAASYNVKFQDDFKFNDKNIQGIFDLIKKRDFSDEILSKKDSSNEKKNKINKWGKEIADYMDDYITRYNIGLGGLHSKERFLSVKCKDDEVLLYIDVGSFYPFIILNNKLFPKHIGEKFLEIYKLLVDERIKQKKAGNKKVADSLKIVINSVFGMTSRNGTIFYDRQMFLNIVLNGQFLMLKLIDMIETAKGGELLSANTDGLVIKAKRANIKPLKAICGEWASKYSYELDYIEYKELHADAVNDYILVDMDGECKGKGYFCEKDMTKALTGDVICDAVREYLVNGVDVEKYIRNCDDPHKFIFTSTGKKAPNFIWGTENIGKKFRFYKGINQPTIFKVDYKNSHSGTENLLRSVVPCMDMTEFNWNILDRDYYINEAKKDY